MVFCAITASILLTAACAVSRLERAVSTLASEVTCLAIRLDWRWKATSASARTALALARSACSTAMSSCTSMAPCFTSLPLSACTSVTMPATWEVTSTPCEENSVPMEVSCSTHCSVRAFSDVTVDGGGTIAADEALDHVGLEDEIPHGQDSHKGRGKDAGDDEAEAHDWAWHWRLSAVLVALTLERASDRASTDRSPSADPRSRCDFLARVPGIWRVSSPRGSGPRAQIGGAFPHAGKCQHQGKCAATATFAAARSTLLPCSWQ